jgi:hypothetical protein
MTRIITGGDRRGDPRLGRFSTVPDFAPTTARESQDAFAANDHAPICPEVVSDLNALFLMIGYVEMELERIAPDCVLAASTLRSTIVNEMLIRSSSKGQGEK